MYKNEYICIFGLLIPLNFAEFGGVSSLNFAEFGEFVLFFRYLCKKKEI